MDPNKIPPTYTPPSEDLMGLLQQFLGNIGQGGGQAGLAGMQNALNQPGGYDVIKGLLPRLGAFMGKGGAAADAYQKSAMQKTYQGAQAGMNMLRGQQGAGGGLGSTIAGMSDASLLGGALSQANDIRATAAGMKEQNIMGRMGLGMQGLSALGGQAESQRGQSIGGYGNMAGLGMQQQGMNQNQLMQGFQTQYGLEQAPQQWQMDIWQTLMNKPKQPSGIDMLLGGLGAAAPLFA